MKCGHCKTSGPEITVAHVRSCGQAGGALKTATRTANDSYQDMVRREAGTTTHELFEKAQEYFAAGDQAQAQGINRPPRMVSPDWSTVAYLRREVANHLHRTEGKKRIGYFAVRVDGSETIKFYRVKLMISGKWAGKTFVDAQASDEWYPVRSAQTLAMVLTAINADPEKAGKLYADELGMCCRCGRTLTDDLSRERGIGPVCWDK